MAELISCDKLGDALARWLKTADDKKLSKLCEILSCGPYLPEGGKPGEILARDENGTLTWIKPKQEEVAPPAPEPEPAPPPEIVDPDPKGPCWTNVVSDTGGETKRFAAARTGSHAIKTPDGLAIVDLNKGDEYTVKVEDGNATFKQGNTTATGKAPLSLQFISNTKGKVYQMHWNTGFSFIDGVDVAVFSPGMTTFARQHNDKMVSPFPNPLNTPGNTALYMVGAIDLEPGDYYIQGRTDDQGIFYVDGRHVGDLGFHFPPFPTVDKINFSITEAGSHPVVIYNKNNPNATPSYTVASVFKSDGTKVVDFDINSLSYSLTTDLNCIEG